MSHGGLRREHEAGTLRLSRLSHPALAAAIDGLCDAIDLVLSHLKCGKPVQRADLDVLEEANRNMRALFPHQRPRRDILREFFETFI